MYCQLSPFPLVYTFSMFRSFLSALLVTVFSAGSLSSDLQTENSHSFTPGTATAQVAARQNPQQSYALYLPAKYSADRRWPIVYVFDPLARGPLALAQFQHAAEIHGYIVAVSNNSRNGPWQPEFEAAEAMVRDTQQRFTVDLKRIYFAGFSGGARVASQLAQLCKCATGVLLSGAGFSHGSSPSAESKFPVFSAVGDADFNYSELIPLQDALEKAAFPHWLRIFDGPHEWAPPIVMDEALAWFRIQAMKSQRETCDDAFIAAQLSAAQTRASTLEKSGQLLAAWREDRQIAATFDSLVDTEVVRAKASELEKQKMLRDAIKREHSDFEEQERLSNEILAAITPIQAPDASPSQNRGDAATLARDLRLRAEREKKPERVLVFKRALAGVFIGSLESGRDALDKKDFRRAEGYFACATEANPESEWAFRSLAIARASSGDRKGALEALRAARKLTKDLPAFSDWLKQEPAFERARSSQDFELLVAK
jgi:dienelactone hydrolase